MSEYLSKEEIKQWRSSLEKITLEEFAARLGKKIEESKPTNDIVDIVLKGHPVISEENNDWSKLRTEKITSIAQHSFEMEKELNPSMFSMSNINVHSENQNNKETKVEKNKNVTMKKTEKAKSGKKMQPSFMQETTSDEELREEVRVVFKKALTDREQKVFDYFVSHSNKIVYAKDLASLLDLPRDYVYKYIKNLRAKIEGESLKNADKGGFILNI